MNTYYIWIILFFCLGYLILTDNSVATLFVFCSKWIKLQYERIKWRILYSPDNPLVKWMIHRRSLKLAKQLEKELRK